MRAYATYGVGMLIGAQIAGNVYARVLGDATSLTLEQWRGFWYIPAAFAAAVLVFFVVMFRERTDPRPEGDAAEVAAGAPGL